MPKLVNIPEPENQCNGTKRDGLRCTMPIEGDNRYCKVSHMEMNCYTDQQISSIKRCSKCKNYRAFDSEEKYCIHCTEKLGSNKIVNKEVKKQEKCGGKSREGNCGQKAQKNSKYCHYHAHWSLFTQDQLDRIGFCKRCEKYGPIIKESNQACDNCSNKKNNVIIKTKVDSDSKDQSKDQSNDESNKEHNGKNNVIKKKVVKREKCLGYRSQKIMERCTYYAKEGERFCADHMDMQDYTDDMLDPKNLKLCLKCTRPRWRYFPDDDRCKQCRNKINAKTKCIAPKSLTDICGREISKDSDRFCTIHKEELKDYTEHMLQNVKYCSSNRHYRYCEENSKICIGCSKNSKNMRLKKAEENKNKPKCIKCNRYKKFGDYCWDHRTQYYLDTVKKTGKKPCANYNRKCKVVLEPNYPFVKCEDCRKKERTQDNNRYKMKQKQIMESRKIHDGCSQCISCNIVYTMDEFTTRNNREYGFYCSMCRAYDRSNSNLYERRNTHTNMIKYNECKKGALKRNKKFKLTFDEYIEVITKPCRYCGSDEIRTNDNGDTYNCNGIDRLDNSKDYIPNNSVSCCSMCNYMKYIYTEENFIKYCKNIYDNYGCEEISEEELRYRKYYLYKRDAIKRSKEFNITEEEFEEIVQYKCYYCANKNETEQIGIDRYDSCVGYSADRNKLVAACKVCNAMKKNFNVDVFYNKITDILLFNKKITEQEYQTAQRKLQPKDEVSKIIKQLKDSFVQKDVERFDRRKVNTFKYNHKYYTDLIWDSFDVTKLRPELVFCDTDDSEDLWKFYRAMISSYSPKTLNDTVGKNIRILIRDKYTEKYLGVAELSSNIFSCKLLDEELGWDMSTKKIRLDNIMNISTCVALPPFSYNFNGGKLVTKLMFSKEVFDYFEKKYATPLAGIITYSLHGESTQYSDLPELQFLGVTSGYGMHSCKITRGLVNKVNNYLRENSVNISKSNLHNISNFCDHVGIEDITKHGEQRGIYFGYTAAESKRFLCEKINSKNNRNNSDNTDNTDLDDLIIVSDEDDIDTKNKNINNTKINNKDIKTVDVLSKEWIFIALERLDELLRISTNIDNDRGIKFKIDHKYDLYFADHNGKRRHLMKQNKKWCKNDEYVSRIMILKDWFYDRKQGIESIAEKNNTTRKRVCKILFGTSQITNTHPLHNMINTAAGRIMKEYSDKHGNRERVVTIDEIKNMLRDNRENVSEKKSGLNFEMIKGTLRIHSYCREDNDNRIKKIKEITDVLKGKWRINKRTFDDKNKDIIDIQSLSYDMNIKHNIRTIKYTTDEKHLIPVIGLYQSNVDSDSVNYVNILGYPYKISKKNNITFSFIDKMMTGIDIKSYYENGKVVRIIFTENTEEKIKYEDGDDIDISDCDIYEPDDVYEEAKAIENNDFDPDKMSYMEYKTYLSKRNICLNDDCWCKFKNVIIKNQELANDISNNNKQTNDASTNNTSNKSVGKVVKNNTTKLTPNKNMSIKKNIVKCVATKDIPNKNMPIKKNISVNNTKKEKNVTVNKNISVNKNTTQMKKNVSINNKTNDKNK